MRIFVSSSFEDLKEHRAAHRGRLSHLSIRPQGLGVATVEAPELPPEFTRIHRQQGRFIHVKYHTVINQRGLFERWVFRHQPLALPFEWAPLGIAAAQLLDDRIGAAGVQPNVSSSR